jgi:ubiquinone biosynthesis protein
VARRIDPAHDIWAAADPIVRRYIARELSPIARARDLAQEAVAALKAIARRLEQEPAPPVIVRERTASRWLWLLLGVTGTLAGLAIYALAT